MSFIVSEQVSNSLVLKQEDVYIKSIFTAMTYNTATYQAKLREQKSTGTWKRPGTTLALHKIARHTELS